MRRRKLIGVALALCAVVMLTACPSKSEIDKAAASSRELAHDTVAIEKVVTTLFESGRLSLEAKDRYADKLAFIAREGKSFNDFVTELDAREKAGTLPANALALISQNFAPILQAYQDIAAEIGKAQGADKKLLVEKSKALKSDVEAIAEVKP
jgi:outer membrane murein-binding lipoprotein Lpp